MNGVFLLLDGIRKKPSLFFLTELPMPEITCWIPPLIQQVMYYPKHRDTKVIKEKVRRQQRTVGKRETEGAVSACEPGGVCETSKCRGHTGQTGWQTGINTEDRSAGERETTQGRKQRAGAWAQQVSIICLINKDRTRPTCPFQGESTREQQAWVKVSAEARGPQRPIRDRTRRERLPHGLSRTFPLPVRLHTCWQNSSRCSITALVHTSAHCNSFSNCSHRCLVILFFFKSKLKFNHGPSFS